ncbi:MAG: trigger factor [Candidatus Moranbacteria bacterium RBG_19FT_COMBO_42_6]|nr:MAG: trigger factor [Candidatus Moranbacteria bacterium RBG_19FT_COMBO_42_6]
MIKKLSKSRIEFEVSVPWSDWEKYLDAAAEEASREIKIPGFRPGKAPRKMVAQKVGSTALLNSAAEMAVQKSYSDYVTKEKLEVIGSPEIELKTVAEGKDLEYIARSAVMPEVTVNEKYKKAVEKINKGYKDKKVAVSDEEVQLELDKLANSRAKLVTVRRVAKKNDNAEIDFTVLVDGVPIENGTSKNHPVVIGKEVFIPGFEDNLVGMKEGEEKEFELEFPKDYHSQNLKGKKATFKAKVNLVQERQIPEINDEFAKSLGNFENLDALKKNMREGMEHEQIHKMNERKRGEYIEIIIENTDVDIPEILIHEETHKMFHEFEHQIQSMGMSLDQYLGQIKKKKDELEKDWEPNAVKRVKSAMALNKIVKAEKVPLTSKEIEEEMNKTLQYYKNTKDASKNIDTERLYNYTKGMMENEKVFQMLEKL